MSLTERFQTASREEMISLSAMFARHVERAIGPDRPMLAVGIGGDYAAGKSLVADAMKAALFREPEIEKARWKRCINYDGTIAGHPATISFVNARYDFLNFASAIALLSRSSKLGVVFISNRPAMDIGRLVPALGLPENAFGIDVRYGEGEPRARQIGPFHYGPSVPIGRREILFSSRLTP